LTHKSRPDYNNQELGTTKAHKGKKMITREQERLAKMGCIAQMKSIHFGDRACERVPIEPVYTMNELTQ
jgi:hypothetical protein